MLARSLLRCATRRPQCLPLPRRPTAIAVPAVNIAAPRRHLYENVRQAIRDEVPKGRWGKNQTMAVIAFLLASSGIGIALYSYTTYLRFISSTMHNYPAPVAKELRRALYYNLYDQPQPAIKHFRRALEQCTLHELSPLSDEVTGIKLELAGLLEKHGLPDKAATVLEHVLDEVAAGANDLPRGPERTRLLKRGVGVGLKLGELYMGREKSAQAEEALVWAVQTMLRERQRRQQGGAAGGEGEGEGEGGEGGVVVVDEGEWLSDEEAGMALESLAACYLEREQHFLATPLLLQALEMAPRGDCHAVVIMNNLSTSLAQQPLPPHAPITRHQLIADSAVKWAEKALALANTITPPARTDECDTGCVAATYNLGEFAEMLGDKETARRRYAEAASLARGLGMAEGVERAEEALGRLERGGKRGEK
ncbi:uncharacterized protein H6S33_000933 [Morchella sextelata]|uniref:uncharacterized protein n=1 Tax=Morchella sextelata TaxID=1174677 RepID=UPI001D055552|nr:uncharacterized protein H6S33_000933 [Morchella sextelata]KAH0615297.1 hypothetical protein H6S33_000933 [Morchella sextelata]